MIDQSDLADCSPLQFIAGVAQDLQIPDERAIGMATNWVAGHCRSRIVEVSNFDSTCEGGLLVGTAASITLCYCCAHSRGLHVLFLANKQLTEVVWGNGCRCI